MICNKNEWKILDNIQHVLLNYYRTNTLKESEIEKINDFIYLCAEATSKQQERNERSVQRIKERRKKNPDYARSERERKNKKKMIDLSTING